MQWITTDNIMIAGIILASVIVVVQIVKFGILAYRRARVKDYNLFVHMTYTQHAKETPAIILRIQNDYIRQYNAFLKRCRFLALFFKKVDSVGESPVKIVNTIQTHNP